MIPLEIRHIYGRESCSHSPCLDGRDDVAFPLSVQGRHTETWAGTFGLLVPGSATAFKLYTLTATGRERGSNAVTVTRPG